MDVLSIYSEPKYHEGTNEVVVELAIDVIRPLTITLLRWWRQCELSAGIAWSPTFSHDVRWGAFITSSYACGEGYRAGAVQVALEAGYQITKPRIYPKAL